MPFASSLAGVRIHYEVHDSPSGSDRLPVVLIQGLGLSSRFWFDIPEQIAHDPKLPRPAITLDNRGTGTSDRPRGIYRISTMAKDVFAVLDACRVQRAVLAGISMGGMIAMHAALMQPSRVAGLVLMATSAGVPHARLPTPPALGALLLLPLVRSRRVRFVDRLLLPAHELDRAAEIFSRWPEAFRHDPLRPRTFFSQLAGAAMHSVGFRLSRITCPTVVVAGADDILIPPANARRIARRIPGAQLEVLARVAHAIPASVPRVVNDALGKLAIDSP